VAIYTHLYRGFMEDKNNIIELLWSEFIDYIKKGVPVYFTFTNDMVEDLFRKGSINHPRGADAINDAVRELVWIDSDHVYLKQDALKVRDNGFSPAILFVCQQILAVEEMADTLEHSENAYFPHLRGLISSDLEPLSQNPFDYQDFEEIWLIFSKEIYRISGNSNCITFTFEKTSGVNKAKRFPLSQALFSKEDVVRLIDKVGFSTLRSADNYYISRCIDSNRWILSSRGRKLVTYVWLRDALVKQVKNLSESIGDVNKIKKILSNKEIVLSNYQAKIYIDNIDWITTEYVIGLFDSTNNAVNDQSVFRGFFKEKLDTENHLIFIPSVDGDCWILSDEKYSPRHSDELLVFYQDSHKETIVNLLASYFDIKSEQILFENIKRGLTINILRFRVSDYLGKGVFISSGHIGVDQIESKSISHDFVGGIAVNMKQDRYFCEFLPEKVVIDGCDYSLEGEVHINDRKYNFSLFREEVKNILSNETYKIQLFNGLSFNLKVSPNAFNIKSKVVYSTYRGQILPILQVLPREHTEKLASSNLTPAKVYQRLKHLYMKGDYLSAREFLINYQSKANSS